MEKKYEVEVRFQIELLIKSQRQIIGTPTPTAEVDRDMLPLLWETEFCTTFVKSIS